MDASQLLLFEPWPVRERVSARARSIRLDVRPDGEVVLTIPRRVSRLAAHAFLLRQRDWVRRTRERLLAVARRRPVLRWDGSDRLPLRGVPVPLAVEPARERTSAAAIAPDGVRLRVPVARSADPAHLARVLLAGLREEARRDGARLLEEESARLGLRPTGLTVRDTRSRWGSCAPDGRIMLSLRLIMAPPEVFRYVVVHELCHLRWHGHGARFWGLVGRQLPDYARHRAWLRAHGDALQACPPRNP